MENCQYLLNQSETDFIKWEKHPKPDRRFAWLPLPRYVYKHDRDNNRFIEQDGFYWLTSCKPRWFCSCGVVVAEVYDQDNPGLSFVRTWQVFLGVLVVSAALAAVWQFIL